MRLFLKIIFGLLFTLVCIFLLMFFNLFILALVHSSDKIFSILSISGILSGLIPAFIIGTILGGIIKKGAWIYAIIAVLGTIPYLYFIQSPICIDACTTVVENSVYLFIIWLILLPIFSLFGEAIDKKQTRALLKK